MCVPDDRVNLWGRSADLMSGWQGFYKRLQRYAVKSDLLQGLMPVELIFLTKILPDLIF